MCTQQTLFYLTIPGDYNEELSRALEAQSALSEWTDLSVPLSERTDQSDERLTPTKVRRQWVLFQRSLCDVAGLLVVM